MHKKLKILEKSSFLKRKVIYIFYKSENLFFHEKGLNETFTTP
jgi:hypothetical protein